MEKESVFMDLVIVSDHHLHLNFYLCTSCRRLKSLTIIFERSWQSGKGVEFWKKVSATPVLGRARRRISESVDHQPHLNCWEGMGANNSGSLSEIVRDKKVVENSQCDFMK